MNKAPVPHAVRPECELLSCLMDSELDAQQTNQLLRALYADPELRAHWTAYHVAGDALRSDEVASSHSASFCVRVSAAIAQEPTVLAPRVAARVQAARRYLAPGLAVAASVAVIGFVAVPLMRSQAPAPAQQQAAIAPPPAVVPAEGAQRRAAATVSNARAMQAYLAAHRELTNGVALPRATPYLRATAEQPEGR